ncbi:MULTISPECIES: bifunctional DNA primase/polymerase [unclassified Streptomyces]|uniref:bifunctional DNA primase/polymerase n=1 Tax=unclassified Streptomyces TaxID=2593676 RepID=UPI003D74C9A4
MATSDRPSRTRGSAGTPATHGAPEASGGPRAPAPTSPRHPRQAAALALAHALSAAEHGLAVIPLSRTKLPALRSPHRGEPRPPGRAPAPAAPPCRGECGRFGHGVYDASTDPARIRAMFAAAPWATGYGIACGLPPHHLIGLDLDTKTGTDAPAALRALARRHRFTIPPTVVVLTPSGGRHLWLTGPPEAVIPNSAGRLAPGIDVRGAGGYLVGPGSRTAHGTYTTAPGTESLPPAPCPRALLRLLLPPPPAPRPAPAYTGGAHGQGLVRFVLAAREGQRNTRLFWAACRAYETGLGPALTPALLTAARHTGLTHHEASSTVASAERFTRGHVHTPGR